MIATLPATTALASLALGYLLGSSPFGLLFAFLSGAGDVRKIGSGSIGATNVLRTGKKWAAALTLLFDAGKGAFAVLLVRYLLGTDASLLARLQGRQGCRGVVWHSVGDQLARGAAGAGDVACHACRFSHFIPVGAGYRSGGASWDVVVRQYS